LIFETDFLHIKCLKFVILSITFSLTARSPPNDPIHLLSFSGPLAATTLAPATTIRNPFSRFPVLHSHATDVSRVQLEAVAAGGEQAASGEHKYGCKLIIMWCTFKDF
jgi:hypothetical protein